MRISVPQLPVNTGSLPSTFTSSHTAEDAISLLIRFLQQGRGKTLILTGAGVSVDSGIRAYRGDNGSYTINKTYRPIFYSEFMAPESERFRQRYWARSYLGYPPVRLAQPNPSHYAIAALQYMGLAPYIITQNVDRLHHRASHSLSQAISTILELHGTLKHVHCTNCKHEISRDVFQDTLSTLNPEWAAYAAELERTGTEPRTNPDGDVDLQNRNYSTFNLPKCISCGSGPMKASVCFFGENVPAKTKERSHSLVENASNLLVVGSALATYSAFRLVKQAHEAGKQVMMINIGQSRADSFVETRIERPSTEVLLGAAQSLAESNPVWRNDSVVQTMLKSGIVRPVDSPKQSAKQQIVTE
ncbi:uncharacterized protein L969DRAFT_96884 [Mixia osmundae IAM 14324]|uniref:Deacetylase sirtuin-type domain-containing protein n=1 Tax=Mixia osmundae (strain CBS 9802 / IAM 14324 / JCM 22182 / KY 12970) TaxID=764103 RepID=G7E2D5_MIXOS|nr:uncharacterized protein L969DRAFT_96884 [Mixia osmundae IAM 14324]KEI36866.1 hypothetical protein L969DRAFT_96884 [Mixia osmundae IAM 14324]GAA96995.1 hypothetical protein E5Q_03669 [Mixia osmundae IAM 14324]